MCSVKASCALVVLGAQANTPMTKVINMSFRMGWNLTFGELSLGGNLVVVTGHGDYSSRQLVISVKEF